MRAALDTVDENRGLMSPPPSLCFGKKNNLLGNEAPLREQLGEGLSSPPPACARPTTRASST